MLASIDNEFGTDQNYLFYMATSPKFFGQIVEQLGQSGLSKEEDGHWRRVVIEKPFGQDLESAVSLNQSIKAVLSEKQIYRIDHYLGKETVQNIMVFRFGNGIFEPIWNRRYIDHVAITNAETVGVELRGGYFDTAGTLRDWCPITSCSSSVSLPWSRQRPSALTPSATSRPRYSMRFSR